MAYKDTAYKDRLREVLLNNVGEPFKDKIDEYLEFLDNLFDRWWNGDEEVREKYAYHVAILTADSDKHLVVRAKVDSYYAYLVYKGYVTAYRLMKDKYVAGAESIYTWLRMYRAVLGRWWA